MLTNEWSLNRARNEVDDNHSELAEMTPEKERGMEEDSVDGRPEQHRRISQQGVYSVFF